MQASDLKTYAPLANGRCSATLINTGVVQNVFPHVTSAQRASGLSTYKKIFWGLANTDNYALIDPELYHDKPTLSADDYVVMWESGQRTATDESSLSTEMGSADLFGSAVLQSDISATDTTLTLTVKHTDLLPGGSHDIFRDGDTIRVCSHSTATGSDGAEEDKVISGTPTYSGLNVTITVTEGFTNAFTVAAGTRASSLLKPTADTEPTYTSPVVTSSAGTFDDTTYPVELDNQGTTDEDITLTFTDATHFTASGDSLGTLGSGDTSTNFAPSNSDFTRPYFTIDADAFGGTFQAGDTITFTTHPARVPIGQLRVVLAGAASLANNKCTAVYGGEAAG